MFSLVGSPSSIRLQIVSSHGSQIENHEFLLIVELEALVFVVEHNILLKSEDPKFSTFLKKHFSLIWVAAVSFTIHNHIRLNTTTYLFILSFSKIITTTKMIASPLLFVESSLLVVIKKHLQS